jgi:hypothetical protein
LVKCLFDKKLEILFEPEIAVSMVFVEKKNMIAIFGRSGYQNDSNDLILLDVN